MREIERYIYFKELVHVIMETQERAKVAIQVWRPSAAEFLLAQGRSVFYSMQAFNWLDEAHSTMEDIVLYSKSTDLNVNLIQKNSHRNI